MSSLIMFLARQSYSMLHPGGFFFEMGDWLAPFVRALPLFGSVTGVFPPSFSRLAYAQPYSLISYADFVAAKSGSLEQPELHLLSMVGVVSSRHR